MALESLLTLLDQELELYRCLLKEQNRKIGMYLQGELDQVRRSMERDKILLEKLRRIHGSLRTRLQGKTLSEILATEEEANQQPLRASLEELRLLARELQHVNLRNYQYTQNSLYFTRAMLGKIFSDSANYNRNGYLQATNQAGSGAVECGL